VSCLESGGMNRKIRWARTERKGTEGRRGGWKSMAVVVHMCLIDSSEAYLTNGFSVEARQLDCQVLTDAKRSIAIAFLVFLPMVCRRLAVADMPRNSQHPSSNLLPPCLVVRNSESGRRRLLGLSLFFIRGFSLSLSAAGSILMIREAVRTIDFVAVVKHEHSVHAF